MSAEPVTEDPKPQLAKTWIEDYADVFMATGSDDPSSFRSSNGMGIMMWTIQRPIPDRLSFIFTVHLTDGTVFRAERPIGHGAAS